MHRGEVLSNKIFKLRDVADERSAVAVSLPCQIHENLLSRRSTRPQSGERGVRPCIYSFRIPCCPRFPMRAFLLVAFVASSLSDGTYVCTSLGELNGGVCRQINIAACADDGCGERFVCVSDKCCPEEDLEVAAIDEEENATGAWKCLEGFSLRRLQRSLRPLRASVPAPRLRGVPQEELSREMRKMRRGQGLPRQHPPVCCFFQCKLQLLKMEGRGFLQQQVEFHTEGQLLRGHV